MRLTFRRMADRRPVETLVERDDGVTFLMRGAGGGAGLPHDLVHYLVERELDVPAGIWGGAADGAVWGSMRHVSGRRPPHVTERSDRLIKERADRIGAAGGRGRGRRFALSPHVTERSDRLIKERADRIGAAEGLADVVARLARRQEVLPSQVAGRDRAALEQAAAALAAAEREWASLTPGDRWVLSWPAPGH